MRCNTRFVRTCAVAGLIAVLPAVPHAQRGESMGATVLAAPTLRIDNFGRVNDRYFRGAQPSGRAFADLAAFGIKTVIDLQADGLADEPARVGAAGMKFYRIPMTTHVPPTAEQLALFLTLVSDPANQPVYVHCAGGRHRTGVMTAIHRMTNDGWSADQAFREMKQYKFGADFLHREFKRFVYAFRASPRLTPPLEAVVAVEAPS